MIFSSREKGAMLPQYKDLQVGIIRIIDGNGAAVVEYAYTMSALQSTAGLPITSIIERGAEYEGGNFDFNLFGHAFPFFPG